MDFEGLFVNLADYEMRKKGLGNGCFGCVNVVVEKATKKEYAAKIFNKGLITTGDDQKLILKDVSRYKSLVHPAILKFKGFNMQSYKSSESPMVLTDYIANGSLAYLYYKEAHNLNYKKWNNTDKEIVLIGVAEALKYLHSQNITHFNLKPSNILISDLDEYRPVVCDFGYSSIFLKKNSKIFSISEIAAKFQEFNQSNGVVGSWDSPAYIAPELLKGEKKITNKVDVYSFAILMYEIFFSKFAYEELKNSTVYEIIQQIAKGTRPELPWSKVGEKDIRTKTLFEFFEKCWSENPDNRPTFDEICILLETNEYFKLDEINENRIEKYVNELHQKPKEELIHVIKADENKDLKIELSQRMMDIEDLQLKVDHYENVIMQCKEMFKDIWNDFLKEYKFEDGYDKNGVYIFKIIIFFPFFFNSNIFIILL